MFSCDIDSGTFRHTKNTPVDEPGAIFGSIRFGASVSKFSRHRYAFGRGLRR